MTLAAWLKISGRSELRHLAMITETAESIGQVVQRVGVEPIEVWAEQLGRRVGDNMREYRRATEGTPLRAQIHP